MMHIFLQSKHIICLTGGQKSMMFRLPRSSPSIGCECREDYVLLEYLWVKGDHYSEVICHMG